MLIETKYVRSLVFLLSLYYLVTYFDDRLIHYMSINGIWANTWSDETRNPLNILLLPYLTDQNLSWILGFGVLSAILLNFKKTVLFAVITTLSIQFFINSRVPGYYLIHRPFIGFITLLLPIIVSEESFKRHKDSLLHSFWLVTGFTYFYSALTKLQSPQWVEGRALSSLTDYKLGPMLTLMLERLPWTESLIIYLIIAIEVLVLPVALIFWKKRNMAAFILIGMHFMIMFSLKIYVVSVPMILFHLFTIDVTKLKRKYQNTGD